MGAGIGRLSNLVLDRGEGSWVFTASGEKYLDFSTGIGVTNLGHCHPTVRAAVEAQLGKLWHAQVNIAHHTQMLELTKRLQGVMPGPLDTFLFVTTGSEAVEAAVKLARHALQKPNVIVFQGGYHGRTLLTMSMTSSGTKYRAQYGPHAAGVHVCPHPYFALRSLPHPHPDPAAWTLEQLEMMLLQQTAPNETAAIVLEPVLGEGGYVPSPPTLLPKLRELCDRHGMLLIADEVQSGFGRTGRMFAVEHDEVVPDVLVFAKGVASGFPLAGVASKRELTDRQPPGSQGGTYAGNAVACAAACATLQVLSQPSFMETVRARGERLSAALRKVQAEHPEIQEVRGPGLMIGVDFDTKQVPKGFAQSVAKACLAQGLIILPTGIFETLRIIPPLTVSEDEVDLGVKLFRKALEAAL